MPMNDNKHAYGNLTTGKVIPAHVVGSKNEGNFPEERLAPDREGPLDHNEWVPGVVTVDGKFHPDDQRTQAAAGRWVVEFRDFGQALTQTLEGSFDADTELPAKPGGG
jgi:hypothetical protein